MESDGVGEPQFQGIRRIAIIASYAGKTLQLHASAVPPNLTNRS